MREKSCKRVVKTLKHLPPPPQAAEVEEEKVVIPEPLPLLRTDDQSLPVPEHVFRVDTEPVSGVVNLLSLQAELRELSRRLDEYIHKTDERFDKLAVLFHKQ